MVAVSCAPAGTLLNRPGAQLGPIHTSTDVQRATAAVLDGYGDASRPGLTVDGKLRSTTASGPSTRSGTASSVVEIVGLAHR